MNAVRNIFTPSFRIMCRTVQNMLPSPCSQDTECSIKFRKSSFFLPIYIMSLGLHANEKYLIHVILRCLTLIRGTISATRLLLVIHQLAPVFLVYGSQISHRGVKLLDNYCAACTHATGLNELIQRVSCGLAGRPEIMEAFEYLYAGLVSFLRVFLYALSLSMREAIKRQVKVGG